VGAQGRGASRLGRIEAVINPAAGRAGPLAAEEMAAIFAELGVEADVIVAAPADLNATLQEVAARKPDVVIILAGDGTARAAAQLMGPEGPLIVPLPGGTMNMLPRALYGEADWRQALRDTLERGVERPVGGGEIGGHTFYVAAMIGSTALFAPAREAARRGRLREALTRAAAAYRRAFAGRLRFQLDGHAPHKTQSLTLMCPMISKVMDDESRWMEAAAIDPANPAQALRIGARVALSRLVGDWRNDPAVHVGRTRKGKAWARFNIPALVDGEPVKLGRDVEFQFHPHAFRALAPEPEPTDEV